jgi:mannose-6-phosphate isomerase-like protein (cupin superfamily)
MRGRYRVAHAAFARAVRAITDRHWNDARRRATIVVMDYDIELAPEFPPLTHIDVAAFAARHEPWTNRTLSQVNDTVIRMGVLHGDFHWHHHETEDEFFLVLEGLLLIDVRDRETVELRPHQGFMVPRGVEHRTRAPERTVVLMVEPAGVVPTGD